jgi:diaminopimelate decarboxylase
MDHFTYKNGELHAENVAITDIANAVGTPFYAYSSATLERHVSVLREALLPLKPMLCFAVKACPNIAILRTLGSAGMGADVVSGGELMRARKAGIAAEHIVFSGVGKTREEIRYALSETIFQFNVESESELHLISEEAARMGAVARIAIRVNPDVDAKTHAKISTGKKENKFGVSMHHALEIYAKAAALPGINIQGVSMHIGSQLTSLAPFEEAYVRARDFVLQLRAQGHQITVLDIGGGLGVPYRDGDVPPPPADYGAMIARIFSDLDVQLICEPGRLIAGNAGVLVTRVLHLKENEGRHYVVVDAGMNDLMRPALYDSHHSIAPIREALQHTTHQADIVGPVCESSDVFAKDEPVGDLIQDDLLAFRTAGAYGASMSGSYNSRALIPEVLVNGDQFAVIRIRPTFEQMTLGETFAPWQ